MSLFKDSDWDPNSIRHVHPAVWPQWPFDEPPKTRERSEPIYNISSDLDLMLPMRDGVRLATDVHRPRAAARGAQHKGVSYF